jgi:hypothetical protein
MNALILSVKLWCEKSAAEKNERLRCEIVEAAPTLGKKRRPEERDLTVMTFRIFRSILGLDYVLVGMRSPRYVHSLTNTLANQDATDLLPKDELDSALIAAHTALEKGHS